MSAAIVLGRCRRSVVVIDDGKPRNRVARSVNGFLGREAIEPESLRELGREQATKYGVQFVSDEVKQVERIDGSDIGFKLTLSDHSPIAVRKVLLATGVRDKLPEIDGLADFYGTSVHHCPYCDGWEHRDERLVAWGDEGESAVGLALSLLTWSPQVTACITGAELKKTDLAKLRAANVDYRTERAVRAEGRAGQLERIVFDDGSTLECDALFFSDEQFPRSGIPRSLGCDISPEGHTEVEGKQKATEEGIFLAGDVCGSIQFAIVAAAEGATAATAINRELQAEDLKSAMKSGR